MYVTYIYKCIHTYVRKCIHKTLHNYVDARCMKAGTCLGQTSDTYVQPNKVPPFTKKFMWHLFFLLSFFHFHRILSWACRSLCEPQKFYFQILICTFTCLSKLNKNTLGVKEVQGQSEAALQIGMYDQKL